MYTFLIAGAAALAVAIGGHLAGWWGWILAIFLGLIVFVIVSVLIVRRVAKRLQPAMELVRRQAESQQFEAAADTLESLLPLGRWVPVLSGQLRAQIGGLAHYSGDRAKALRFLSKAGRRAPDAQLLLACIKHKEGDTEQALEVLAAATAVNKRHVLLHNVHAFLLKKAGMVDEAKAQLAKLLRKVKDHQVTKNNLLRLQNAQKLDMKSFGMEWYALQLERPPAEFGTQQGRKGFRQPPKSR